MLEENQIDLELTDMGSGGEAVGRHDQKVVFVPFGVTGDRVRARIVEDTRRNLRAEISEILESSQYRVEAPCPHFGMCGGCQWQHIEYAGQMELKQSIVIKQLQHRAQLADPPVKALIGMADPWGYRNQVDFLLGPGDALGFLDTHYLEFVPIEQCPAIAPWLWDLIAGIEMSGAGMRSMSERAGLNTDDALIILEPAEDLAPELELDVPISCVLRYRDGVIFPLAGDSFYHELIRDRLFRISANSFFPVNTAALEAQLLLVEEYLAPVGYETILDLFCGVGTFGISLADQVGQVIGIESDSGSIEDARSNSADCDNVLLMEGDVEKRLGSIHVPIQAVIIDPPRDGCPDSTWEGLNRLRPQRIIHLSDNVGALARDATQLSQLGYRLQEVQPIDVLPHTSFIGTVSLWSLA